MSPLNLAPIFQQPPRIESCLNCHFKTACLRQNSSLATVPYIPTEPPPPPDLPDTTFKILLKNIFTYCLAYS